LELKKFSEQLDGYREVNGQRETFPEQAIRYAWHLKVEWVILTNFKEVRLYNSYYRKPADGLRLRLQFSQFINELDRLWILSRPEVEAGELDKIETKAERKDVDKAVLDDLLEIRRLISDKISASNNSLSLASVRENVQKIIDRLIVIRVAEDRGLIGFGSLRIEHESWERRGLQTPFMRSLKTIFRDFDEIYNTKLFAPHACEDLVIDNSTLKKVIDTLYQYNFDFLGADVLGAIYEDYLGHVLQETTSGGVQIIESGDTRKKEGIYYTPTHLVEYIVKRTIGEMLDKCNSPDDVAKIKVLDPACGSGSFLIKAFDVFKQWYENYNSKWTPKDQTLAPHFQKITDIDG
jgi:type I restriction-modification system DNA methylase subunit